MLLTGGPGTARPPPCVERRLFDALGLESRLWLPHGAGRQAGWGLCGAEGTAIRRLLETQYDPHARLVFAHDESNR